MSIVAFAVIAALTAQEGYLQALPFGADLQPRFEEGLATAPARSFYIGGYLASGREGPIVVHFYAMDDPDIPRIEGIPYASIPVARRANLTSEENSAAVWAEGRSCPALYGVLAEFGRLQAPLFTVPPLTPTPRGAGAMGGAQPAIHGSSAAVWGFARQADGAPSSMFLTAGSGRLMEWQLFAERRLAACWNVTPPMSAAPR